MILSMTGYGRAARTYDEKTIQVEIRALNSKLTDLKLRLPADFKEKEMELRKLITDHAQRGKLEVAIEVLNADGGANVSLNEILFRGYHRELSRLSRELQIDDSGLLAAILRIPNVVATAMSEINEDLYQAVCDTINDSLQQLQKFRREEGQALKVDLSDRVQRIRELQDELTPFEKKRFERMRERMRNNLAENFPQENIDANRFEQEVLYYLEKMDITEEKVRLEQHCKYFLEKLNNPDISAGRTLNFISQEMGREINTLGAKAYDADIQRIVVQMKDELEKIKEQLANVL